MYPRVNLESLVSRLRCSNAALVAVFVRLWNWDRYQDSGSGIARFNLQVAVKLRQSFAHASDAHARALRLNLRQFRWRHALALILNVDDENVSIASEPNPKGLPSTRESPTPTASSAT